MRITKRHSARTVWAAMRALYEGAEPTPELLSVISGRAIATVAGRVRREGWKPLQANARLSRLQRLIDEKTARIEGLRPELNTTNKALLEVVRIEMASVGLLERLAAAAGTLESRTEIARARDEEIGSILQRINDRIVELARCYAADLAAKSDKRAGRMEGKE